MRRKIYKAFYIFVVLLLFMAGCTRSEGQRDIPSEAVLENEKNSEEESEKEAKGEGEIYLEEESEVEGTEDDGSIYQKYSYAIGTGEVKCMAEVLGIDFERPEGIDWIPILVVNIPGNSESEWVGRINKLIIEQCIRLLPMYQEWLRNVEMQVVYRSDRYLCYKYVSRTNLPEEYADPLPLYITVDLAREKTIDYPFETEENGELWTDLLFDVDEEWEEYVKKPVEEQDRMRGETGYKLCQETWECENGISFPYIQVKGMEDEEKQERVNRALQEPLKIIVEEEKDSSKAESMAKRFREAEIYVAYKSEQWLSVEYSIYLPEAFSWNHPEHMIHFGVTVDMHTGEQVMLDDLFDVQGLIEWGCINAIGKNEEAMQKELERAVRPEKEIIEKLKNGQPAADDVYSLLLAMRLSDSFYLCQGRIVLFHQGIPLQDVSQYLKVDPWYD